MPKTIKKEIFAVGKWNGMDFSVEDLKLIATAFHTLGDRHQVPLKMGHNNEQPMTDGQPALGWVVDVYVEGDKLIGEFSDVPDLVSEAFDKKLYRNVSIELDFGVEYKGSYFPMVLSGVALLGADLPAVNTLDDLQAYMERSKHMKRAEFSTVKQHTEFSAIYGKNKEEGNMSDSEAYNALKAQYDGMKVEMEKLITKNNELEQKIIQMKADYTTMEEVERNRKQAEARALLLTRLESMVKAKKITPRTRDEFMRDYDQADDKNVVVYSVEKLESTIDANPAYFGAEQARLQARKEEEEQNLDVSSIVVQRAKQYQVEHGEKDFTVAKRAVLQADLKLAAQYTKMAEA
jgi:hypothetical protein